MEKLPKIVASQLARGAGALPPGAEAHPDPDLLTAFVERSLPERERGQVVGHLAECAACRDVVALAQPELVTSNPAFTPKPFVSRGFWLRWGALAACAVLAVTLVPRHSLEEKSPVVATKRADESPAVSTEMSRNEATDQATDQAKPRVAASPSQPVAETSLPSQFLPALKRKAVDLDRRARQAPEIALGKEQATAGILNIETGKVAAPVSLADKKAEAIQADQLTAAKPSTRQREENSYSTAAGGVVFGGTTQTVEVASSPAAVEKDKDVREELHASSAPINGRALSLGKAAWQAALWQITAAGELQCSFDSGKSWESVSLGQPVRLRVMAMSGLHVWVAGNNGVLFHSRDGGSKFTDVAVKDKHASLTGDIVVLEFADALHGRLETAGHEVWATSDGGKSWRKQ